MNLNLRNQVDKKLDSMIENFYNQVPHARYQRDSNEIDKEYFKRHTIETIIRIRHKRMVDAMVIHYFTKNDMKSAKAWAEYIEDEMLHGNMFYRDLESLYGLSIDEVYQHDPLFSTKLLNGYFYFTLEHEGPMASIASAYFLEYTTRKTQPDWLDNLERIFGKEHLRGARGHVNHDIKDNHSEFVWNVLIKTIKSDEDEKKLFDHLDNIYRLFCAYFTEIYYLSIGSKDNILTQVSIS